VLIKFFASHQPYSIVAEVAKVKNLDLERLARLIKNAASSCVSPLAECLDQTLPHSLIAC
jgi:hypothetical protein